MGISASKNKKGQKVVPSIWAKFIKKIIRMMDWIAEGQTAGALCKG